MPKTNHTHKLKRIRYKNSTSAYICVLDCTFKADSATLDGRTSICNRCGKEFRLSTYSLTLKFPHCSACHGKPLSVFAQYELNQAINNPNLIKTKTAEININSLESNETEPSLINKDENLERVEFKSFTSLRSRINGISKISSESIKDDIL